MISASEESNHSRIILGLIAVAIFFVCFKPIVALSQYPAFDDLGYLSLIADRLGMNYWPALPNSYPPGVVLVWLPAALVALVYGWLAHVPDVTALPMFVGLLSYAYWCGCLFLLEAMIRLTATTKLPPRRVAIESLVALLGVPLLYYGTHRTTMVHTPELFLALATAFFVLKKKPILALGAAILLFSVRLNDVPVLLFALAPALEAPWSSLKLKRIVVVGGVLVLVAALVYVVWLGFYAGYNRFNLSYLVTGFSTGRIRIVLFSGDWGLVWTAPAWLLCLIAATVFFGRLSLASRLGLVWMLCELVMCFVWPGNGSDFAYRYLTGSYAAALIIAFELFRSRALHRVATSIRALWAVSACWLTWVAWIYKERPQFTPYQTPDRMWTHPDLMWNSLTALANLDNYLMPLPHSTIGAIYYTWILPQSPYALPGGTAGAKFQVMVAVSLTMIALAATLAFRIYRPANRGVPAA